MKRTNVPSRLRTKASHTAVLDKRCAIVVGSYMGSVKDKWNALSPFGKHWCKNIALGVLIELGIHVSGHTFHVGPVLAFQNWGLDVVTRLSQSTCVMLNPSNGTVSILSQALRCPDADGTAGPPLLIEVDAETWRSPSWGHGEPERAPRDAMATLIDRAFELGASQIVLDILVEDHVPLGAPAPPAGTAAALAQVADQLFADRLSLLLSKPYFGQNRRLVLVRTERHPLPQDESAFVSELRHSMAVDKVVAASNERIVIAAPYFQVGADRRLRDWDLFKVVCERQADGPEHGLLRVVPSVQLVMAAFAGTCPQAPVHNAGQPFARCGESTDARSAKAQAKAAWTSTMACTPFPALGAANLSDTESTVRACTTALQLEGIRASNDSRWCAQARMACRAAENPSQAAEPACAALMTRLDATEATRLGVLQAVRTQITAGQVDESVNAGIVDGYWSAVQQAFDPHLGALPREGGVGNRIVFRYPPNQVTTINALQLLTATGEPLRQFGPLMRGRVVVIGQTFSETGDAYFTPLGRMPGAVVLVNAIDSMSRHGLMQAPTTVLTLSVAFALIVAVSFGFTRWTSAIAAGLATLAVVFTSGVASFFFFAHGVWLDFAAPIIGILIHSQWDAHKEREELKRLSQLYGVKPGRRTRFLKRRV